MARFFASLVVCFFISAQANAQHVGDDARVLFGNIPSTQSVIATQTNLLNATDLEKASRTVHLECYWLGRYQESLAALSKSIEALPAYGDTGKNLLVANQKLGTYCGLQTFDDKKQAIDSPIKEQNRKDLHAFIDSEIKPLLAQVDATRAKDEARQVELKDMFENKKEVATDWVKKLESEISAELAKKKSEIDRKVEELKRDVPKALKDAEKEGNKFLERIGSGLRIK